MGTLVVGLTALIVSVVQVTQPAAFVLRACFNHAGGLRSGDPVLLSGVHVGKVRSVDLDRHQRACAALSLRPDLGLDRDTAASILTLNVLGEKYVSLEPGGDTEMLASGSEIQYTQSALQLERIVIRMIERHLGTALE